MKSSLTVRGCRSADQKLKGYYKHFRGVVNCAGEFAPMGNLQCGSSRRLRLLKLDLEVFPVHPCVGGIFVLLQHSERIGKQQVIASRVVRSFLLLVFK